MDSKKRQSPKIKNQHLNKSPFESKILLSPNSSKLIAITGGIATGKTFVLNCLKKFGFESFNADQAVHNLLKRGGNGFEKIAKLFPNAVTNECIDRKLISEDLVLNPEKLSKLEFILHPLVAEAQVEFMVRVRKEGHKSIVFEIPLLFEKDKEKYYDYIILTTTNSALQKKRALLRSNMTEEKFDLLVKRQLPSNVKAKKAHFIINTSKSFEDTFMQIKKIVRQ